MIVEYQPHHAGYFSDSELVSLGSPNARVIERGGEPVALVVAGKLWDGVWQVGGSFADDLLAGQGLWLIRQVRAVFAALIARDHPRQIRCLCITHKAAHFCHLLGFEPEGIWHGAAPDGGDCYIMVWTRRN